MRRNKYHLSGQILLILTILISFASNTYSQTMHYINASDNNIQYVGRIDDSNPDSIVFSYPGVTIQAVFEGTSIEAVLHEFGSGSATTTNYFNVIIDEGEPTVLKLSKAQTHYTLAENLSDGTHTIKLFKRTESNVGKVAFTGFGIEEGKTLQEPAPLPLRKMLFIGNSITCGYGNEIATTDPDSYHFTSANENNYNAWGAITARNLDAQYHAVAYSGKGLFRNIDGSTANTAPVFFNRTFPDESSSVWDHSKYVPDVVVINLGTNDFGAEVSNSASFYVEKDVFVGAYVDFISDIRTEYPQSAIICAVGVMMNDYYPSGAKHWTRIQEYVSSAVDSMNARNDKDVFYLKLDPQSSPYGEDWHPTTASQTKMANTLTKFIQSNVAGSDCSATVDLGNDISTMSRTFPIVLGTDADADASVSYRWYKNKVYIAGETLPTLTITENDDYAGIYRLEKDSGFCHYSDELLVTDSFLEVGAIANWSGNKKAAVVLSFDDWSNGHPKIAVPQLEKRNLVGTFNITTDFVSNWVSIQQAFDNGNEIANHSKSHPDISKMDPADFYKEISQPEEFIESKINGLAISTFAYPFGTFNTALIDTLKAQGYVGSRGVYGSSGNYTYNFAPNENDYFNILTYGMSESVTEYSFTKQITNIIHGGGLLTYLYHSLNSPTVTDNNYAAVPEYKFEKQLDSLLAYQDQIWITTFSNALKYHKEKNSAKLFEISAPTDSLWELNLTDTLSANDIYNQPLSILLPLNGKHFDMIKQGDTHIIIDAIHGDTLLFKAVPDGGTIQLINTAIETSMQVSPQNFHNSTNVEIAVEVQVTSDLNAIVSAKIDLSPFGGTLEDMVSEGNGLYSQSIAVPVAFPAGSYRVDCFFSDSKGNIHTVWESITITDGIEIGSFSINAGTALTAETAELEFAVTATDDDKITSVNIDASSLGLGRNVALAEQTDGSYYFAAEGVSLTAGTKYVTVSVYDNAGNLKKKTIEVRVDKSTTGIDRTGGIQVYPNPTKGMLVIRKQKKPFTCLLYNSIGHLVLSAHDAKELDVSDLPNGVFSLKIIDEDRIETVKLVKQ